MQLGQRVSVDTGNGVIEGEVSRIDPAAQNGTVTVDVTLEGPLGQADSVAGLFRLVLGTDKAVRTRVARGSSLGHTIEVLDGLAEGDKVILSDASTLDDSDCIRLD
jgi:HlyD family secretion protein